MVSGNSTSLVTGQLDHGIFTPGVLELQRFPAISYKGLHAGFAVVSLSVESTKETSKHSQGPCKKRKVELQLLTANIVLFSCSLAFLLILFKGTVARELFLN